MDTWCGYGVFNPDLENRKTWADYIDVEECEQHIWNEEDQEWETDEEYDADEDEDIDNDMDKLEKRAKDSIKPRKAAFDKVEREIRKENTDMPHWVSRIWFYLTTIDAKREKEILEIEKDARKKDKEKSRKKSRERLFKRLNMPKRRRK